MADYFVSEAGNDSTGDGSFSTPWRTIKKGAETAAADGRVFVLSTSGDPFGEGTISANYSIAPANANVRILVVNDFNSGSPGESHLITTAAERAVIDASGGVYDISYQPGGTVGSFIYGVHFKTGDDLTIGASNNLVIAHFCNFEMASGLDKLNISGRTRFVDCNIKFGNTGQRIYPGGSSTFEWIGGQLDSGGSAVTRLYSDSNRDTFMTLIGVDISNMGTGDGIFSMNAADAEFRGGRLINCILNTTTPIIESSPLSNDYMTATVEQSNDDQELRREYHIPGSGAVLSTSTYRDDGWQDEHDAGSTRASWLVTTGTLTTRARPFRSAPMMLYNATEGSAVTVTVYTIDDFTSAPDKSELWLEVIAMSASATESQAALTASGRELIGTTALSTNTKAWTESLTGERKLSVQCTFTPQVAGWYEVRLCLAKYESAKSLYYCPLVDVS